MQYSLGFKESMGKQEVLEPNMVQAMSAGTGVIHSEFNPSPKEPVHLPPNLDRTRPKSISSLPTSKFRLRIPPRKGAASALMAGPDKKTERPRSSIQDARMLRLSLSRGRDFRTTPSERTPRLGPLRARQHHPQRPRDERRGRRRRSDRRVLPLQIAGAEPNGGEFLVFDLANDQK